MTTTTHDARCEQAPGGRYHGLEAAPGFPIPCHCPARALCPCGTTHTGRDPR
jgi:hypothetical protein